MYEEGLGQGAEVNPTDPITSRDPGSASEQDTTLLAEVHSICVACLRFIQVF